MGRKRRILVAALLVAFLGALAWAIFHPREPMYQGKPLSYWLEGYNFVGTSEVTSEQADVAVRAIGSNAIPAMLRLLRANDPPWKIKILSLLQKQKLIKIKHMSAWDQHYKAELIVQVLRADAASAVPAMIDIFDRNISTESQQFTAGCLATIGPAAKSAIPTLIGGLTNTDNAVRYNSIIALGSIRSEPQLVVPTLVKCLSYTNEDLCRYATKALSAFGADARPAVPALVALLNDPYTESRVQKDLIVALAQIHSAPELAVPALTKCLGDQDWSVCYSAIDGLSAFGAEAKSAVSALVALLDDTKPYVSAKARNALQHIDPEAAAKAGVK